jgi:hypothetical protein
MLVSLRQANARQGRGDRSELALQRVAARAMAVPFVYAGGGAVARWFGRFVAGDGAWPRFVLQHTPVLQTMARQRVLPQPPLRAFRDQWADLVREDMRGSDGR